MALGKYRLSIVFDYMLHNGVIVKKAKAVKYMRKKHVLVDLIKVYTDLDIALPNILTTCVFFALYVTTRGTIHMYLPFPLQNIKIVGG